jgi:molybdate transport system substrate-binding protein
LPILPALVLAFTAAHAPAAEIHVMTSGGFSAALTQLTPQFERQSGDKLMVVEGASMGSTPTAIPVRLAHGESADVVIMARTALDSLVNEGKVVKGSEVDLVRSRVGLAVKAGAHVPNISTVEGLKQTLLQARSIAYSDSASGVYVQGELFKRLGIAEEVASKCIMIPGTPVGLAVASGKAEVGFQQMSELLPIKGIKVVGAIPESVQKITIFSAGIVAGAKAPDEARKLIDYLSSPKAWKAIRSTGVEPIAGGHAER